MGRESRRKRSDGIRGKSREAQEGLLMVILALDTGMREGEIGVLRNADIDLTRGQLRVPDYDDPHRLRAIKQDADQNADQVARTGIYGVLNPTLAASEIVQLKRIGTLVRFGVRWACDFPYYEIGHNAEGGQDFSLKVRENEDDHWQDVTRGDSWEGLFLATERAAREGQWWSREPGARQRVYDTAYARRLAVNRDPEDAHDIALGAADYPELDFIDYFIPWVRVAPEEVRKNATAMKLVTMMDEEIPGVVAALFPETTN
jgi:hypothetical protein